MTKYYYYVLWFPVLCQEKYTGAGLPNREGILEHDSRMRLLPPGLVISCAVSHGPVYCKTPCCNDSESRSLHSTALYFSRPDNAFSFQPSPVTARCCQGSWAALWWFVCRPSSWPPPLPKDLHCFKTTNPCNPTSWRPLHPPASVLGFARGVGTSQLLGFIGYLLLVHCEYELDDVMWSVFTFPGKLWHY